MRARKLKVRIEPPGARALTFNPAVRAVEASRELRWLGRLLLPCVFEGEHSLRIEPLEGGRSRFVMDFRAACESAEVPSARGGVGSGCDRLVRPADGQRASRSSVGCCGVCYHLSSGPDSPPIALIASALLQKCSIDSEALSSGLEPRHLCDREGEVDGCERASSCGRRLFALRRTRVCRDNRASRAQAARAALVTAARRAATAGGSESP
jgi:hypothetical protein